MAPSLASIAQGVGLCGQLHPLPLHWVLDSLAHCSFSLCPPPHVLSEDCGLESFGQGHPYHCESPKDYCCLLHCASICGHISQDYSGCWYHCCLIWSVSQQTLTEQSGAATELFPPWWPLWPSSLPSPGSPCFCFPPSGQLS